MTNKAQKIILTDADGVLLNWEYAFTMRAMLSERSRYLDIQNILPATCANITKYPRRLSRCLYFRHPVKS